MKRAAKAIQNLRDACLADFRASRLTRDQAIDGLVSTGLDRTAAEWLLNQTTKGNAP